MAQKWTDEQKARLTALHQQGKTFSQIAAILGGWCSRSAVAAQVKRMRDELERRNNPIVVDIAALAAAWKNPELTSSKIGELFGISPSHVRAIAAANRDLFQPRNSGKKTEKKPKPQKKHTTRVVSAWARRDPSQPAPSYYDPMPMDDYEIARLPHAKPLHDLAAGECKWPLGEDRPYMFCACQTTQAGTYCAHHVVKAVGVGTKSEREATKLTKRAA